MAIVLETEGSILSIQIQLKPIYYAYINATQINVLISNEIQCKYNTNTCIQLKCHKSWPSGESIQGATTTHQRDMYIYMCYLFSSFYAGKVCVKSQTMHSVLKGGSGGG